MRIFVHQNNLTLFTMRLLHYSFAFILKAIPFLLLAGTAGSAMAQETTYGRTAIKAGIGLGYNSGEREMAFGMLYTAGWQKSYGKRERLRIHPHILMGTFRKTVLPIGVPDQTYKISTLGMNVHYDLVAYKFLSLVTTAGGFINYSRGLIAAGGKPVPTAQGDTEPSVRGGSFHSLYVGGAASLALRIAPPKSPLAYEIKFLNLHFGNNGFFLGHFMFGMDFKLKK